MSKFIKYLNENFLDNINKNIQDKCKYYLNITKEKYIFNRAITESQTSGIKSTRQNRQPRVTDRIVFKRFNNWLEENKHVRRDNSVSAINNPDEYSIFGNNMIFFPIGKFNYTWVKSIDINMTDARTGWTRRSTLNSFFDNVVEYSGDFPFESYFTTNKGIEIAWKNKYEIWFDCKEYYYFNVKNFKWLNGSLILIKAEEKEM